MIIGKIIGNIWATKKDESLEGFKFFVVKQLGISEERSKPIVAVDGGVGAGIGDDVLITQGSSARMIYKGNEVPIDAVIVGVIDSLEIDKSIL
ncbi:MAG: EutN/CcmL family microcompartment protein [Synergistaceae bacterium]|nr:EutN/CcmL family microcompartment protein [Synergistaceae bacterium]NLW61741.1 EutN/CcmL family microcompartment protein [Synergistaceae bacterium]